MSQRKSNLFSRVHEVWTEMDHAQRRLFEIRTGVPATARSRRAAEISGLEDAYAASSPTVRHRG